LYENGQETGFVDVKEFTEMMRQNRMNMIQTEAMCEYSNVLIRGRRQSRDKQCNGQKKKDIRTNNHLQNIT
jgi:hypothetical protein